jgi:hypothetical protein
VKLFYGISFGYVFGDVAYTGYLEEQRGSSNAMVKRQVKKKHTHQQAQGVHTPHTAGTVQT